MFKPLEICLTKLTIIVILFCFIPAAQSLSTVPLQFDPFPHLQTAVVSLIPTSSPITHISTIYTYQKAKRVKPNLENVFVGVNQMDYKINQPTAGSFKLYFSLSKSIPDNTKLGIGCSYSSNKMSQLKVSILVISPDFFYKDIYSHQILYFSGINPIQSITLTNTTYVLSMFLIYCNIETLNTGNGIIGISLETVYTTYPNIDVGITFYGNLNFAYVDYRVIVWYPVLAKEKYNIQIGAYNQVYIPPPYQYSVGFDKYKVGNSIFFMALKAFNYDAISSSINQGFKYSHTLGSDPLFQLVATTTLDDQFTKLTQVYILINRITCPNTHPIRGVNRITLKQQCFDQCYENEYIEYLPTQFYHQCTICSDTLCKSCESATKCSSCVYGYDLVENTQTCVLNNGYYISSSGVIFLCNNSLTGCQYCTDTGTICNVCFSGYFFNSGKCKRCDTITAHCTNCTSTKCLSCLTPKVLINATLCSDPIPNQPPPQPQIPCKDSLCFQCSSSDPSLCLYCQSDLYKVVSGECKPICGDGIIVPNVQICDDSNTNDNDGCSSNCQIIQPNFNCDPIPHFIKITMFMSKCYYTKVIQLSLQTIYKHPKQNTLNILLKNHQPKLHVWQQVDMYNQLIKMFDVKIQRFINGNANGYCFDFSVRFVSVEDKNFVQMMKSGQDEVRFKSNNQMRSRLLQSSSVGNSEGFSVQKYSHILLQLSYRPSQHFQPLQPSDIQSLNHQQLSVTFNPTLSQRQVFSLTNLSFSLSFPLITQNNHLVQYYDPQYYTYSSILFFIGVLVSVCGIVMLIVSIVSYYVDGRNSRVVLVTLQTVAIGQLTYFSILQIGQLNPFFINLLNGLKWINGYDLMIAQTEQNQVRQTKGLNIQSLNISNNVNISMVIIFILMLIGAILILLDRLKRKNPNNDYQNRQINENVQDAAANNNGDTQSQSKPINSNLINLQKQNNQQKLINQLNQPKEQNQQISPNQPNQLNSSHQQIQKNQENQPKQQIQRNQENLQQKQIQRNQENRLKQQNQYRGQQINQNKTSRDIKEINNNNSLSFDPQKQQEKQPSTLLNKISTFFVFNLSLFLFLFFLYKFIFFTCIQTKFSLNNLQMTDMVIIALLLLVILFFLIIACVKFDVYDKVMEKILDNKSPLDVTDILGKQKNISQHKLLKIQTRFDKYIQLLPQNEKPPLIKQFFSKKRINIKLWYLIIFILQHIINMTALIMMSSYMVKEYLNIVPIALYVMMMIFFIKNKPYKGANMFRLYGTYFVGIVIQSLLLVRSIIANQLTPILIVGKEEPSIGIYVPFTVAILLLILEIVGLCYVFYSIKRIRCCQLEIQWQRIQIGQVIKMKLKQLVKEQSANNDAHDDEQENQKQDLDRLKNNKDHFNNKQFDNKNQLRCLHNQKQEEQSQIMMFNQKNNTGWQASQFNSTDSTPFFNIPFNIRKQINGIHKLITDQNKQQSKKKNPQVDYTFREINREITSKLLKREIKQKLLNSKIERKIMLREGVRNDQLWNVSNSKNKNNKNNKNKQLSIKQMNFKDISCKSDEKQQFASAMISSSSFKNKQSRTSLLSSVTDQKQNKHKQTINKDQQLEIRDENGENIDYLYTDTKVYNVYQEFDMI